MAKATFGLDENIASAGCYLLGWLTGIVFFVMEKENKTVRFHAMQSILTFLPLMIIIWVINMILFSIMGFGFWMIANLLWLLMLIVWLFLMLKAFQGEKFKVPVVGDIAESQV
jgi:uncharacterized membrane protein